MGQALKKHVVIIGAGPCGLAAADHALDLGFDVTLLEQNAVVGGKAHSRRQGQCIVDYGPHAFHAMSKEITDVMRRNSQEQLVPISIVQTLYVQDKPLRYPLHLKEVFTKFRLRIKFKICRDFCWASLKSIFIKPSQESFKSWGIAQYGKTLYDYFFGRYTERVWGISADRLSVEFAKRKLPNLSVPDLIWQSLTGQQKHDNKDQSYFNVRQYLYHQKGIGQVYDHLAQSILKRGGKIIYNARVSEIHLQNNSVASVALENPKVDIPCDYVVSSAHVDDLARYLKSSKPQLGALTAKMPFKHGIIVNALLNRVKLSDSHWIYLVDDQFYFNRLSEPKNFSSHLVPKDKTLIMLETICSMDDDKWQWEAHQWKETVRSDLGHLGVAEKEIEELFLSKMDRAYPFYLTGYETAKKEFLNQLSGIPNLITTGRYGLYMDTNMHDAMVLGRFALDYVTANDVGAFYQEHERICLRKRDQA